MNRRACLRATDYSGAAGRIPTSFHGTGLSVPLLLSQTGSPLGASAIMARAVSIALLRRDGPQLVDPGQLRGGLEITPAQRQTDLAPLGEFDPAHSPTFALPLRAFAVAGCAPFVRRPSSSFRYRPV